MVECNSKNENYTCETQIGDYKITADTTPDKGGHSMGIRPHDILATAYASCLNINTRMACQARNIPVDLVTTKVELIRKDEETVFSYKIEFDSSILPEEREKILKIVEKCPVRKTLSKPIRFERQQ